MECPAETCVIKLARFQVVAGPDRVKLLGVLEDRIPYCNLCVRMSHLECVFYGFQISREIAVTGKCISRPCFASSAHIEHSSLEGHVAIKNKKSCTKHIRCVQVWYCNPLFHVCGRWIQDELRKKRMPSPQHFLLSFPHMCRQTLLLQAALSLTNSYHGAFVMSGSGSL